MFTGRWNWLFLAFAAPIALILLHQLFATTWSNKCDPGNASFYLMKNDGAASFKAPNQLFTWENDGPDNSWLCDSATLSLIHVGYDVNGMFDATRGDMTRNGWLDRGTTPDGDFAVYEKTIDGVKIDADVWRRSFYVEVDMHAPASAHFGAFGFSNP